MEGGREISGPFFGFSRMDGLQHGQCRCRCGWFERGCVLSDCIRFRGVRLGRQDDADLTLTLKGRLLFLNKKSWPYVKQVAIYEITESIMDGNA